MARKPLQEDQMVKVVRNALLVAGQEMGGGDQWPAIKDTIGKLEDDWKQLKIEQNVDAELQIHLYDQLDRMEAGLPDCSLEMRQVLTPKIAELREVCDAYFDDLDRHAVMYDEDAEPAHIKRMREILGTLETGK